LFGSVISEKIPMCLPVFLYFFTGPLCFYLYRLAASLFPIMAKVLSFVIVSIQFPVFLFISVHLILHPSSSRFLYFTISLLPVIVIGPADLSNYLTDALF